MHESEPLVAPDTEPRPVTVLLHAMCSDEQWICDWLQYFEMAPQWQLCPRAPGRCSGGGYEWTASGEATRGLVEAAIASAVERHPGRVREDATVLVGSSQGAYAVAALVHDLARHPGSPLHVAGILVQGGSVRLSAEDLRTLDARVAFAAGDLDAASPAMHVEALRLQSAGIDARYVSLGADEGHFLSPSTGKRFAEVLDWCRAR